jgi:MerR family transcriptional regulator, heat shock protein HspR
MMSRVNLGPGQGSRNESAGNADESRRGLHLVGEDSQPSSGVGPAPGNREPIYGISVAAELTGVSPATLRAYESKGLVRPGRTRGGTRRYSAVDIAWINRITTLLGQGLNLAGVEAVLRLERETSDLRQENDDLREQLDEQ